MQMFATLVLFYTHTAVLSSSLSRIFCLFQFIRYIAFNIHKTVRRILLDELLGARIKINNELHRETK